MQFRDRILITRMCQEGLPPKHCYVCNKKLSSSNAKYFCSMQCMTRFRVGLGVDYTTIVCEYPNVGRFH
jgi:hypoxanthine-guanine phosphoribosyltransferase